MKVPVSRPRVGEIEIEYVNKALRESAVSGVYGEYIERFENEFAQFCGTRHAVACANGTVALHLALAAAGIKAGDEVLVSTLTNMASFFAVMYLGAKPVPVDIDLETLNLDPTDLEHRITPRTRAIMAVHLFGHPCNMGPIDDIARKHGLLVFEDGAEAHGATYKGRRVGSLGHACGFSFFANKVLATGEGGMVTTDDEALASKARSLRALAFGRANKFMHEDIGFNYRMTNLQAALGCGQMMVADQLVAQRRSIAAFYDQHLGEFDAHLLRPQEKEWAKTVYWMYHIVLREHLVPKRNAIMAALRDKGVETREGFIPYNLQDVFIARGWTRAEECPRANKVAYASFYLPTGPDISTDELEYVVARFGEVLRAFT
jgi:perosamine synthetase